MVLGSGESGVQFCAGSGGGGGGYRWLLVIMFGRSDDI
jgi:hypothetical protein